MRRLGMLLLGSVLLMRTDVVGQEPEKTIHLQEKDGLYKVLISKDNKSMLVVNTYGTAKIWDLVKSQVITELKPKVRDYAVEFHPQGRMVILRNRLNVNDPRSRRFKYELELWQIQDKEAKLLRKHLGSMAVFAPDGKSYAVGEWKRSPLYYAVSIYDTKTGKLLQKLKGHLWKFTAMAYSADGKLLAVNNGTNAIKVWNLEKKIVVSHLKDVGSHKNKNQIINKLVVRDQGKTIYSFTRAGILQNWDTNTCKAERILPLNNNDKTRRFNAGRFQDFALSADGKIIAFLYPYYVALYEITNLKRPYTINSFSRLKGFMGFLSDNKTIAVSGRNNSVNFWNYQKFLDSRQVHAVLKEHENDVYHVAFSPDSKWLASASGDKTIKLWDVKTGKLLHTFQGHKSSVLHVAFSSDGKRLVSGSLDETAKVWDVATGKKLATLRGHKVAVYTVSFSPDGKRIATTGADRMTQIWNAKNYILLHVYNKRKRFLTAKTASNAFSPDSKSLAIELDQNIIFMDVATGKFVKRYKDRSKCRKYIPQAGTMLFIENGRINGWYQDEGQQIPQVENPDMTIQGIFHFSPEGSLMARRVFDYLDFYEIKTMKKLVSALHVAHQEEVTCYKFSPNGEYFATSSKDDTVKIWKISRLSQYKNKAKTDKKDD